MTNVLPFRSEVLEQIEVAARWRRHNNAAFKIQVDGGVTAETIGRVAQAGADVFVSGHGVFRQADPVAAIRELRELAEQVETGS